MHEPAVSAGSAGYWCTSSRLRAPPAQLLSAYPLHGFIPMTSHWQQDAIAIRRYRRQHGHRKAYGVLLPDSLSSALSFKLAGLPSCGYRDDGRSLLLRWPLNKPQNQLHAGTRFYIVQQALGLWNLGPVPEQAPTTLDLTLSPLQRQEGDNSLRQPPCAPATIF